MYPPPGATAGTLTEEEVWRGKPSFFAYLGSWLAGILLLPLGVGFLLILQILLARARTQYVLTNLRVLRQTGIFLKSSNEVRLSDVRSINVRRQGLGGWLGIGTVEFSSAATDRAEVYFAGIEGVEKVRDLARRGQSSGDVLLHPRLTSISMPEETGGALRFLVLCAGLVLLTGSLIVSAVVGAGVINAIRNGQLAPVAIDSPTSLPRPARIVQTSPAPRVQPPAERTPAPTPVPTPASPTFLTNVRYSQQAAVLKRPELGRAGSLLNIRFGTRLDEWKARHDPRLNRSDWPERLADEVAGSQ